MHNKFLSRKFLVAILSALLVALQKAQGDVFSVSDLALLLPGAIYIAVEGLVDMMSVKNGNGHNGKVVVTDPEVEDPKPTIVENNRWLDYYKARKALEDAWRVHSISAEKYILQRKLLDLDYPDVDKVPTQPDLPSLL